jgi:hypothetical protein
MGGPAVAVAVPRTVSRYRRGLFLGRAAQPDLPHLVTPAVERSAAVSTPQTPPGAASSGGQPGHPGQTRTLRPVEEVDEVVVLKPERCSSCHAPLVGDDPTPFRHQVLEIPPIKPVMTEYPWHQLVCPACGATTRAPWPEGGPSGTYGPRVHAPVALCTGS